MVDDGAFESGNLDIDWDHLLANIPDDLNFDTCDLPAADGLSTIIDSGCSLSIDGISRYLMEEHGPNHEEMDHDILANGFFSDLILDTPPRLDRPKESSESPQWAVDGETDKEDKEKDNPDDDGANCVQILQSTDDYNDPLAKKRKRQMRNRDAAVRSRERKKMYVKDLEMKSKFYEAECKRLGIMLQCCVAENQALRLSLHTNKAFDAPVTKQESAVLVLESLLLGSLLGLLDIIVLCFCLLLTLPTTHHLLPFLERTVGRESVGPPRSMIPHLVMGVFSSFMMGRTCKAARSRMKSKYCISGCTNLSILFSLVGVDTPLGVV